MSARDDQAKADGAGWKRVAEELSARPPEAPGPFARERMARVIDGRRASGRATTHRTMPIAIAGVAVLACAAALVVAWRSRIHDATSEGTARIAVVTFEGAGGATAEIAQGGELRTAPGLVATTQIAGARVTAEGASAMRLASLDPRDVRVALISGSVRIAFHPSSEGDRVTIRTRDADVVVVGTVFRVELSDAGTRVTVTEGRVRVIDRDGVRRDATPGHEVLVPGRSTNASAGSAGTSNASPSTASVVGSGAVVGGNPTGAAAAAPVREDVAPREVVRVEAPRARARSTTPTAEGIAPGREDAPQPAAPDPRARLAAARSLLERGQHAAARTELASIGASGAPTGVRVEALTLLAESHQATGGARTAAGIYERAASVGRGTGAGGNARFAQARLLERRLGDSAGARDAYRRYMSEYPRGALRRSATEALCRLGDADACGSRAETEGP